MNVIPPNMNWGINVWMLLKLIIAIALPAIIAGVATKRLPGPLNRLLISIAALAGLLFWGNFLLK